MVAVADTTVCNESLDSLESTLKRLKQSKADSENRGRELDLIIDDHDVELARIDEAMATLNIGQQQYARICKPIRNRISKPIGGIDAPVGFLQQKREDVERRREAYLVERDQLRAYPAVSQSLIAKIKERSAQIKRFKGATGSVVGKSLQWETAYQEVFHSFSLNDPTVLSGAREAAENALSDYNDYIGGAILSWVNDNEVLTYAVRRVAFCSKGMGKIDGSILYRTVEHADYDGDGSIHMHAVDGAAKCLVVTLTDDDISADDLVRSIMRENKIKGRHTAVGFNAEQLHLTAKLSPRGVAFGYVTQMNNLEQLTVI